MATDKSEPGTENTAVARLLASHRRFLDFLTTRVGKREDTEDILQDAFVRGLQKAGEIRDEESAVAWFYRLLRIAVIDHYRRTAAGRKALEAQARESPEVDPSFDADLERTVCECVNDLVPLLKPEYSELIRRVDLRVRLSVYRAAARGRVRHCLPAVRNEPCNACGNVRQQRRSNSEFAEQAEDPLRLLRHRV